MYNCCYFSRFNRWANYLKFTPNLVYNYVQSNDRYESNPSIKMHLNSNIRHDIYSMNQIRTQIKLNAESNELIESKYIKKYIFSFVCYLLIEIFAFEFLIANQTGEQVLDHRYSLVVYKGQ